MKSIINWQTSIPTKKGRYILNLKEFIIGKSMYMYWSRCQYEIILLDWPSQQIQEKVDVHQQIMMNIEIFIDVFIENIKSKKL